MSDNQVFGFCCRCRQKRWAVDPVEDKAANGRKMFRAKCIECNTTVVAFKAPTKKVAASSDSEED